MKIKTLIMLAGLLFVFSGCSTTPNTVVLPQEGGTYQIVAYSSSENQANQDAVEKATDVCNQRNQHMIVMSHASQYQGGLAKGDKELLNVASQVATVLDPSFSSVDTSSSEDY
ncbi:MAG: hypothetical protein ABR542_10355, partial [Desulfonatronovibrio sp.]